MGAGASVGAVRRFGWCLGWGDASGERDRAPSSDPGGIRLSFGVLPIPNRLIPYLPGPEQLPGSRPSFDLIPRPKPVLSPFPLACGLPEPERKRNSQISKVDFSRGHPPSPTLFIGVGPVRRPPAQFSGQSGRIVQVFQPGNELEPHQLLTSESGPFRGHRHPIPEVLGLGADPLRRSRSQRPLGGVFEAGRRKNTRRPGIGRETRGFRIGLVLGRGGVSGS